MITMGIVCIVLGERHDCREKSHPYAQFLSVRRRSRSLTVHGIFYLLVRILVAFVPIFSSLEQNKFCFYIYILTKINKDVDFLTYYTTIFVIFVDNMYNITNLL